MLIIYISLYQILEIFLKLSAISEYVFIQNKFSGALVLNFQIQQVACLKEKKESVIAKYTIIANIVSLY